MTRNETGRSVGGEFYVAREGLSPRALLEDNTSPRAVEGRAQHATNKAAGKLILVSRCSDARNLSTEPEREAVIRSVDGAPNFDSFSPALLDPIYSGVVLEGHFAGESEIEGQSPKGCGGRGIKDKLLKGAQPKSDIERWVQEHVAHSDLVLDLFERSGQISRQAGKDLLLVARDHLDQTVYPVMAFLKEPLTPPTVNMQEYDPTVVYKNGIPHLTSGQLRDSVFEDYLNDYYSKRFPALHKKFGLSDRTSQLTQNPGILLLTTETMPVELWLPNLAEKPGRIFVETLARTRNPETGRINVTEEDLSCVVKQTDYPLDNFTNLRTIVILTEEEAQSQRALNYLKQRDKFQRWADRDPRRTLIVGEIDNGVLSEIKALPAAA